jgi:hypothetical protein
MKKVTIFGSLILTSVIFIGCGGSSDGKPTDNQKKDKKEISSSNTDIKTKTDDETTTQKKQPQKTKTKTKTDNSQTEAQTEAQNETKTATKQPKPQKISEKPTTSVKPQKKSEKPTTSDNLPKTDYKIFATQVDKGHFTSDDFSLKRGVNRSFTKNSNSVTDNITKLKWQDTNLKTASWDKAENYCKELIIDGESGWRVPTQRELLTLLDFGKKPLINNSFSSARDGRFWSSTEYPADRESYAYFVDFSTGFSAEYNNREVFNKSNGYSVRCVKGETIKKHDFQRDDSADVVVDKTASLMWEDTPDTKNSLSVKEAIKRCEDLKLAGFDDWHLPNINELFTITDRSRFDPAIDDSFLEVIRYGSKEKDFHTGNYWSSTLYQGPVTNKGKTFYYYRTLNMQNGASHRCRSYLRMQSRCVRSK